MSNCCDYTYAHTPTRRHTLLQQKDCLIDSKQMIYHSFKIHNHYILTSKLSAPRHRNNNRYRFFESQTKSQGISAVRSKSGHFSLQNISQPQPYRYRKRSPPRIWTSLWAPLAVFQCMWPCNENLKKNAAYSVDHVTNCRLRPQIIAGRRCT